MFATTWGKKAAVIAGVLGVAAAPQALALSQGDWLVRAGYASVNPNDDSGQVGAIGGSGVEVDSGQALYINAAYMLTDNVGLELLAATPFSHEISATGSIAALGKIAEVKHLPPTLSLQYYFNAKGSFRPYIGAGINYTLFFDEDAKGAVVTDIDVDNSWGLAGQVGFDLDLGQNLFLNADVRYISIETTASTNVGDVDVDINPWVYMVGLGIRF